MSDSASNTEQAAPMEIALKDQRAATAELNNQRKRLGLEVWLLETKSGVSMSSFFAWKSGARIPTLVCMVALAQTLGFQMLMRHVSGKEYPVMTAKGAMRVINAERRIQGLTVEECGERAGISAATLFALASGKRDARMGSMVAIGGALGFELVLRPIDAACPT